MQDYVDGNLARLLCENKMSLDTCENKTNKKLLLMNGWSSLNMQ